MMVILIKKLNNNIIKIWIKKNMNENKKFCTTVKSLFPNKIKFIKSKSTGKDEKLPRAGKKAAKVFNGLFVNIVPNLSIYVDFK